MGPTDDDSADAVEQASIARIEAGGIPLSAEARLRELTGGDAPFTSTLSVNEFALMSELGPTSLGQVMGASVHQIGWQYLPVEARWGRTLTCGLDQIEHAWYQARRRALDRLTEEARLLNADAVIGVKLRRGAQDWARGCVDYVVTGTAIRFPGSTGEGWPQLSDLSVQDYWKLASAGWTPAGLCASTAVYFVSMSTGTRFNTWITAGRNQELEDYSRGFTVAREAAVRALRSQADAAHGWGVVGVSLEHDIHDASFKTLGYSSGYGGGFGNQRTQGWGGSFANSRTNDPGGRDDRDGLMITVQAVGTAISRAASDEPNLTNPILRVGER